MMFIKSGHAFGFVAGLFVFTSCGDESSALKQILGQDDRVETSSMSVGVLSLEDGTPYCTAYFVSSRKVVTASHCVSDDEDQTYLLRTDDDTFRLSSDKKDESTHTATLISDQASSSWLETSKFGIPQALIGLNKSTGKISISKFSEFKPYEVDGMLIHHYATERGSSGAPIINEKGEVLSTHIGSAEVFGQQVNVSSLGKEKIRTDILDDFKQECWAYNPFCGSPNKKVRVCKQAITVNGVLYYACSASVSAIPASCTVGSAMTAGTACWANMGVSAAACGVSMSAIVKLGLACVEQASK